MKYMGSKARISKDIAPILNKVIEEKGITTYIEPFVGGANMIQHIQVGRKIGVDKNEYLIAMWNRLKEGWVPPAEITKEEYKRVKDAKDVEEKALVSVVGFCSTYNAKWFGGYAGRVTTKTGVVRDYYDESVRNILKQLPALMDVEFKQGEYSSIGDVKGALIYCDPPYANTTKYKDRDFDYIAFWDWVREKSKDNEVYVSEYNAPEDFECVYEKTVTTTLNKNSRKKDTEKLFKKRK